MATKKHTKTDTNEAAVELLARIKAGVVINPEDGDRFAAAMGVDADEVNQRAAVLDPVFEWTDAQTRQGHVTLNVPSNIIEAEDTARKVMDGEVKVNNSVPQATGSNDPEVNPAATGKEPFSTTTGVGHSGQVINPEEYRDDKKSSDK